MEIKVPVYDGDKLADDFRMGSFLLKGTTSSWTLTVTDKRVEVR